jgi:hypothetical protein
MRERGRVVNGRGDAVESELGRLGLAMTWGKETAPPPPAASRTVELVVVALMGERGRGDAVNERGDVESWWPGRYGFAMAWDEGIAPPPAAGRTVRVDLEVRALMRERGSVVNERGDAVEGEDDNKKG